MSEKEYRQLDEILGILSSSLFHSTVGIHPIKVKPTLARVDLHV